MSEKSTLDCHRMLCPMPVIRVQDHVATLKSGDVVEAICTDPGVVNDIPAWCRINGYEVVEIREDDDEFIVVARVGDAQ